MTIEWVDEPPPSRRTLASDTVPLLKERPGCWALVKTWPAGNGNPTQAAKTFVAHGCEAVARKVGDAGHLYARWPADSDSSTQTADSDTPVDRHELAELVAESPSNPVRHVAQQLGISQSAARSLIADAKRDGLLPPSTPT